MNEAFNTRAALRTSAGQYTIHSLAKFEKEAGLNTARLPYSIRVLLESMLRCAGRGEISGGDILALANWKAVEAKRRPLAFYPGRVLLQDLTGVAVLVDLAAMRSAAARRGGDPATVNPLIPVDLVVDHSIQVDYAGTPDALKRNGDVEFSRNRERYEFLRWAQQAFRNLRVVPPATGIVHQVNLEYLSPVVLERSEGGETLAFPDSVIGTDSHTTMINALGVPGWGVGGIEAISAMLGQPLEMVTPDVVGFKLSGALPEGATPTDLALTVAQILRRRGVVDKFIEFCGDGVETLSLADRAIIANMTPEYGATVSFFPLDQLALDYLRLTNRPPRLVELVEAYAREQGLLRLPESPLPEYSGIIELDLGTVEPSLAGPKRPQDRVPLRGMREGFRKALTLPKTERGFALKPEELARSALVEMKGKTVALKHGSVVIAAITSCTNTSDPLLMLGAGLVAKKAVGKGLRVNPTVKTSLSPGSRVVTEYLKNAGLLEPLEQLGFYLAGYGCMTCIGNSGPLAPEVTRAITSAGLAAATVISGNRNFEGRVHPLAQANYLASPPLVVAYALAGTVDIDLTADPLGFAPDGLPVYLKDIWYTSAEVQELVGKCVTPELFNEMYADVFAGSDAWNALPARGGGLYPWDAVSTYIQEPPYFARNAVKQEAPALADIHGARALAVFGDSITTDHISPAGSIPPSSAAGLYLQSLGVKPADFNSYGSRRGNDRVMARGTFANIRVKNLLIPGSEGSVSLHLPDGEQMSIYDTAARYMLEGVPLVVLAGKEYGSGSSRDWAAKGPMLQGVKAVIASSFERIHRSNLAGMGILPLQFADGDTPQSLGLNGREVFNIEGITRLTPGGSLTVTAVREDGSRASFNVTTRLNTAREVQYMRSGGILNTVLEEMLG